MTSKLDEVKILHQIKNLRSTFAVKKKLGKDLSQCTDVADSSQSSMRTEVAYF